MVRLLEILKFDVRNQQLKCYNEVINIHSRSYLALYRISQPILLDSWQVPKNACKTEAGHSYWNEWNLLALDCDVLHWYFTHWLRICRLSISFLGLFLSVIIHGIYFIPMPYQLASTSFFLSSQTDSQNLQKQFYLYLGFFLTLPKTFPNHIYSYTSLFQAFTIFYRESNSCHALQCL